ncbi:MAG: flagellar hook-length control protein FliK [Firmicutes bacterium]|nr:flagellar hook-length control protein FliK [Candidatus Fermentithermobacillaceae bacterium]
MERREVTKTNGLAITVAAGQGLKAKPDASLPGSGADLVPGRPSDDLPVSFQALVMALLGVRPAGPVALPGAAAGAAENLPEEVFGTLASSTGAVSGAAADGNPPEIARLPWRSRPEEVLPGSPGESRSWELAHSKTGVARSEAARPGCGSVVDIPRPATVSEAKTAGELSCASATSGSGALTPARLLVAGDRTAGKAPLAADKVGLPNVDESAGSIGPEAPVQGWAGAVRIREIPVGGSGFPATGALGQVLELRDDPGQKVPATAMCDAADPAQGVRIPATTEERGYASIPGATPVGDENGAKTGEGGEAKLSGEREKSRGTPQVLVTESGITRTGPEFPVDKASAVPARVASEPSLKHADSTTSPPSGEGARLKALEMQIVEPELGKLTVLLTSRGSDLNVRFLSADARVREVLWETRYELYDAMSGKGLNLTGFTVESGWCSAGGDPAKGRDRVTGSSLRVSRPAAQADPAVVLQAQRWGLVDYLV